MYRLLPMRGQWECKSVSQYRAPFSEVAHVTRSREAQIAALPRPGKRLEWEHQQQMMPTRVYILPRCNMRPLSCLSVDQLETNRTLPFGHFTASCNPYSIRRYCGAG